MAANQGSLYHARERRRSLAGVLELFRTHRYDIPTATIDSDEFVAYTSPVTFATAIRITDAAPVGLVFELGNATTAIAAWIDDTELSLRAGNTGDDAAVATFTVAGGLSVGLRMDLIFAAHPGTGRIRIWGNGIELARATAVNGEFPNGWAAASDGAFAATATGALPADVTQTGTPTNFEVIAPLSSYASQYPRHFV